jgi:hypothetical protein
MVMLIKISVAMIYLWLQVSQHQQTMTRIPEVMPTQKQTWNSWLTCARGSERHCNNPLQALLAHSFTMGGVTWALQAYILYIM